MPAASSTQSQSILDKISECRKNGDFIDFKILCDGVDFDVHKIILCSQSPVFHAACTGKFREASDSTYQMTDESILVVKKLLDYLYTGDYSELINDSPADVQPEEPLLSTSPLQIHAQMFALGDKYCIPELCNTALEKYLNIIESDFDPFAYLESIPDVFFSPLRNNTGLKDVAVRVPRDKLKSHLQDASIRAKYDCITAQVPEFTKQLLETFWDAPLLRDCEGCGPRRPMSVLQVRCRKCGRGKDVSHGRWSFKDW